MNALGSGMEWRMMSKQARACGVKGPKVAPRAGGRTRSLRHPPSSLSSWTKTSARCPVVPRAVAGKSSEPVSGRSVGDSGDDFAEVGQICAVLGTQWGDEGKGKLVDAMAQTFGVVARAQGGANAGHTIYSPDGTKHALHLMPCGILNPDAKCVIGNGCVIHIPTVLGEIEGLREKGVTCDGRLFVSDRAHVLLDLHKEVDGLRESELADKKIGTTKRGIGPCYSSKAIRNGIRVHDLLDFACFERKLRCLVAENEKRFGSAFEYDVEAELEAYRGHIEQIRPYISDSVEILHEERERGSRILIEGANATMLDLDFGTYPFVTSSSTTIGGVCSGLGMAPNAVSHVVGVAKAYTTRVGAGPYPTEIHDEVGDQIRALGGEYGTTTGRPRRCGWLDIVALRYACAVNGFTYLNITKLDVLSEMGEIKVGTKYVTGEGQRVEWFPADLDLLESCQVEYETLPGWLEDISGCRSWQELPANARRYVERIEELVGVPVRWIGVGPGRDALITK